MARRPPLPGQEKEGAGRRDCYIAARPARLHAVKLALLCLDIELILKKVLENLADMVRKGARKCKYRLDKQNQMY